MGKISDKQIKAVLFAKESGRMILPKFCRSIAEVAEERKLLNKKSNINKLKRK
jgi:hypothetical protein